MTATRFLRGGAGTVGAAGAGGGATSGAGAGCSTGAGAGAGVFVFFWAVHKPVKRSHDSATNTIVFRIVILPERNPNRAVLLGLVAEAILGAALDNPASMTLCKNGEVFASP